MTDDRVALIDGFYAAFARRDAEAMAACYAANIRFSDPVFTELRAQDAGDMWRMLCERAIDLEITHGGVRVDGDRGQADWVAHYTFSGTGRPVVNRVHATFRFEGDKIADHRDHFDMWAWTRMALGVPGVLLGWSGVLQRKVGKQAMEGLRAWQAGKHA